MALSFHWTPDLLQERKKTMLSIYGKQAFVLLLITVLMLECGNNLSITAASESASAPRASSIAPMSTAKQPSPVFDSSKFAFPTTIDPSKRYLFYLHGKIIEDQGIPAVSPDYGEYEYKAILEKLNSYGFIVISEQRAKNTDSMMYAKRISEQVVALLNVGISANNITIIGASKGAGIAIFVSELLGNKELNFGIMGFCDPATVAELKQNNIFLYGNVLSIYDSNDQLAGSCRDLFSFSEGKGLSKHAEVVLNVGTGHGILYKPMDEWIIPTIQWAGGT